MRISVTLKNSQTKITLEHPGDTPIPLQDALCALEKAIIGCMLNHHGGIKARAADALSLNRTTLVEKAKKYGFPLTPIGKRGSNA